MRQKKFLWFILGLAVLFGYGLQQTLACGLEKASSSYDSSRKYTILVERDTDKEFVCHPSYDSDSDIICHPTLTTTLEAQPASDTNNENVSNANLNFSPGPPGYAPPSLLIALILLATHFVIGIVHTWIREKRRNR